MKYHHQHILTTWLSDTIIEATLTVPHRLKTLGLILGTRIQKINDILNYILEDIYYWMMDPDGNLKETNLKILGFAGSLRVGSYNEALLHAATNLLRENTTLEIFGLDAIPPFNKDLEIDMPRKVMKFKSKIRDADAILIATPEYNYSVPGVLKNAIDFAS